MKVIPNFALQPHIHFVKMNVVSNSIIKQFTNQSSFYIREVANVTSTF